MRFRRIDGNVQATEGAVVDVGKQNFFAGASVRADWRVGDGIYDALAARQRAGAACARADAERNMAVLQAGEAYFDLLRAQTALEVARASIALYEGLAAETKS